MAKIVFLFNNLIMSSRVLLLEAFIVGLPRFSETAQAYLEIYEDILKITSDFSNISCFVKQVIFPWELKEVDHYLHNLVSVVANAPSKSMGLAKIFVKLQGAHGIVI